MKNPFCFLTLSLITIAITIGVSSAVAQINCNLSPGSQYKNIGYNYVVQNSPANFSNLMPCAAIAKSVLFSMDLVGALQASLTVESYAIIDYCTGHSASCCPPPAQPNPPIYPLNRFNFIACNANGFDATASANNATNQIYNLGNPPAQSIPPINGPGSAMQNYFLVQTAQNPWFCS